MRGLKLLGSVFVLGLLSWSAEAIDSECSACEAVADELQRRLDAEYKRTHLDMRHRLDKDGNRYGKILNYRVSEQRAVNLLDDLCKEMDDYTFVPVEDRPSRDTGSSSDAAASSSGKNSKKRRSKASQEHVWVKYKGDGSTKVAKSKRPSKAEEEQRGKQLTTFCGMMLERYEDKLVQAIKTDEFTAQGVSAVLCQQITQKCRGKQYALPDHGNQASSEIGQQEL